MAAGSNAIFIRALLFVLVFIGAVFAGYHIIQPPDVLPVYHPKQLDQRLVDPEVRRAGGAHHIMDFALIDQRGDSLTLSDTEGRIIVADFFFTTCPTICPKMSVNMARVQESFKDEPRLMLLSHSVTPETDTPEVLYEYAERHDADHDRWRFLTGDRRQIYDLARRSYFAALDEGDGGPQDFVHTENFVLVDSRRRLRGFYDGTSDKDVDRLIKDLRVLLKEERELLGEG
jgi:protein SCO1